MVDLSAVSELREQGLSAVEIARRLGVGRSTVYRHLAESCEPEEAGEEPGPVEEAVAALIAGRELDADARVVAAEAVVLARKVDVLGRQSAAAAGVAIATVSKRLEECRAALERQAPADALTQLRERRAWRLSQG